MKQLIYTAVFITMLFSCQKPEDRTCWKSVGEETTLEIETPGFNKIKLHEHIQYVLVQDSLEKVVINGGKNLVNFIKAEVKDNLLDISNENKCAFLRTYKKKIKVEIHFKELIDIHFEGTDSLTNIGTLEFDWVTFLIRDGSGSVRLNFNTNSIYAIISHGWGDFVFTGNAKNLNLNIRSNGYCDTYGLAVADSLTVVSKTEGTTKVNVNGAKFKAEINSGGNILYKGIPLSIKFNQYGTGELINAN